MKKLILSLALIGATVAANAASFNWGATGLGSSQVIYTKGSTSTTLYTANNVAVLYLFDAAVVSQDALLTSLRSGGNISTMTSVASQNLANTSKIASQNFEYGEAGTGYNFYTAVLNGEDVFITSSVASSGQASDTAQVWFSGLKTASQTAGFDETATFATKGAGWYAVPEPTSGLLMMVGCALLALKRKRA